MTEEEKQAAEAYIKLHEDVKKLILDTVVEELMANPHGELGQRILFVADKQYRDVHQPKLKQEMENFRIVYRGHTAPY